MKHRHFFTLIAFTPILFFSPLHGQATTRLEMVDEQIRTTEELLASIENEAEKPAFEKKLNLLQMERAIVLRRMDLQEREERLSGKFTQNAKLRLHDFLNTVAGDPSPIEKSLVTIKETIKENIAQRETLEKRILELHQKSEGTDHSAEEMKLDILNEDLRALRLRERSLEFALRLIQEGGRISEYLESLPVNPRPNTRGVLTIRRYRDDQIKLKEDILILIANLQEQKTEVQAAQQLSQAQLEALDEEIQVLEDKLSGINKLLQRDAMLSQARSQKRLLAKKSDAELNQIDSLNKSLEMLRTTRDLYEKQIAFIQEYYELNLNLYLRRVLMPLSTILGIFLLYMLLSRVLFPFVFERDELFNARRLGGYLVAITAIVVISIYFLDDLQAIATVFGIAGAALVIALQDLLSSIAGWFVIVSSRKIRVGHRVEVDGHRGDIIDIQLLRTTLIELNQWLDVDQPTGRIVVIPNSYIFKSKVVNYSHMHRFLWGNIDVLITFESSIETARELLTRIINEECASEFAAAKSAAANMENKYGVVDTNYEAKIYTSVEDSGVLFKLLYVSHYKAFSATRSRISNRIAKEFEQTPGIEFAYPTMRYIPTAEKDGFGVRLIPER